jgi:hypothetical protein
LHPKILLRCLLAWDDDFQADLICPQNIQRKAEVTL